MKTAAKLNDVVALLADVPETKLARGQVGTVVEVLSPAKVLVEFADDDGKAFAITAVEVNGLLVLQYEQAVA
jgi:Domain of unknown function (DUF4926)